MFYFVQNLNLHLLSNSCRAVLLHSAATNMASMIFRCIQALYTTILFEGCEGEEGGEEEIFIIFRGIKTSPDRIANSISLEQKKNLVLEGHFI